MSATPPTGDESIPGHYRWAIYIAAAVTLFFICGSAWQGNGRDTGLGLGLMLMIFCVEKNPWLLGCSLPLKADAVERIREPELAMAGLAVMVGSVLML